tara:strand:- start:314 stop:730 length:417 start_codon:yes stop_codon:yes gene_type:complete
MGLDLSLATGLAEAFFVFAFELAFSESDLEVERLRGSFPVVALSLIVVTSFNGTFVTVVRGWKKPLVTSSGSGSRLLGWYCLVTISVIVLAFFLGAFPFSGDEFLEVDGLLGTSISYDFMLAMFVLFALKGSPRLVVA